MEDRRIQSQIARAEKIREAEERKAERIAARIAAKEQRDREKAERAAERFTRRVRLAEAKKRQEMASAKGGRACNSKRSQRESYKFEKEALGGGSIGGAPEEALLEACGRRSKQDVSNSATKSVIQAIGLPLQVHLRPHRRAFHGGLHLKVAN